MRIGICLSKSLIEASVFMAAVSKLGIGLLSYTFKELWEEVEPLEDAASKNYHEGLAGKNAQDSSQKATNNQKKTVNDAKNVQHKCGIYTLLVSMSRAKSHYRDQPQWTAHDHKIIEKIKIPE